MGFTSKQLTRALGYLTLAVVSDLAAHPTPPTSLEELWGWVWTPLMKGLVVALGSLGLNMATPGKRV